MTTAAKEWPEEHDGFKNGDIVRVAGMRGDFEWVNAYLRYGVVDSYTVRSTRTGTRSFVPERVSMKRGKK